MKKMYGLKEMRILVRDQNGPGREMQVLMHV